MVRKTKRRRGKRNTPRQRLQLDLKVANHHVQGRETLGVDLKERLKFLEEDWSEARVLAQAVESLRAELTCALSLSLFRKPVATDAGSIYERKYIATWLARKTNEGKKLTDPCTGLVISLVLTPVPALKRIVESVKNNCLELDLKQVQEALEKAQKIKQCVLKRNRSLRVTVQLLRGSFCASRTYHLKQTVTIDALKSRFLIDVLGLEYAISSSAVINASTLRVLESKTSVLVCELRDRTVLCIWRKRS